MRVYLFIVGLFWWVFLWFFWLLGSFCLFVWGFFKSLTIKKKKIRRKSRGSPYTSAPQVTSSRETDCRNSGWHEPKQKPQNSFMYLSGFQQWKGQLGDKAQLQAGTTRVRTASASPDFSVNAALQLAATQNVDFDPQTLTYVLKDFPSHHHFLYHLTLERDSEEWDLTTFLSHWLLLPFTRSELQHDMIKKVKTTGWSS